MALWSLAVLLAAVAFAQPEREPNARDLLARAARAFEAGQAVDAAVRRQDFDRAVSEEGADAQAAAALREGLPLAHTLQITPPAQPPGDARLAEVRRAATLLGADEAKSLCLYARGECPHGLAVERRRREAPQASFGTSGASSNAPGGSGTVAAASSWLSSPALGTAAPDLRALNSAPTGLPSTVRTATPRSSDADRIGTIYRGTVDRMTREGLRSGSGEWGGIANNMKASLLPGSRNVRCYDQAELLQTELNKTELAKRWTFNLRTYTGEGHEANGHWWIEAIPKERTAKTIVMDPWKDEIREIDARTETAIKPFGSWAIGATGSLLGLGD